MERKRRPSTPSPASASNITPPSVSRCDRAVPERESATMSNAISAAMSAKRAMAKTTNPDPTFVRSSAVRSPVFNFFQPFQLAFDDSQSDSILKSEHSRSKCAGTKEKHFDLDTPAPCLGAFTPGAGVGVAGPGHRLHLGALERANSEARLARGRRPAGGPARSRSGGPEHRTARSRARGSRGSRESD